MKWNHYIPFDSHPWFYWSVNVSMCLFCLCFLLYIFSQLLCKLPNCCLCCIFCLFATNRSEIGQEMMQDRFICITSTYCHDISLFFRLQFILFSLQNSCVRPFSCDDKHVCDLAFLWSKHSLIWKRIWKTLFYLTGFPSFYIFAVLN